MVKKQDTLLPVLTHILAYITSFIAPLIILIAAEDANVKNHARAALNWQLSFMLYIFIGIAFMLIASVVSEITFLIMLIPALLMIVALSILDIVFCIMAAVKASERKLWKYPLTIPFTKTQ